MIDPLRHCAFCALIFAISDEDLTLPPVFRDANGQPRRACWRCTSDALRIVHAEGRAHGQLALITAADVAQHRPAKIWSAER